MATTSGAPRDQRVVGVIDLRAGMAVHARGGAREGYPAITEAAGVAFPAGDALALATFYTDLAGLEDVYIADLDAIAGRDWQVPVITTVAAKAGCLWLDAGIATVRDATRAIGLGAKRVVVGLETLPSYAALEEVCGPEVSMPVALSLDLRAGVTVESKGAIPTGTPAREAAARAAAAGVGTIIVLDLARVGQSAGCDLRTVEEVRRAAPQVELLVGGGVRDEDDLERLASAGCDGALVATALLSGALRLRASRHAPP